MNKFVTDFFLKIDSNELNYWVMGMNIIFKALRKYCQLLSSHYLKLSLSFTLNELQEYQEEGSTRPTSCLGQFSLP